MSRKKKASKKKESAAKKRYFERVGVYLKHKRMASQVTQQEVATRAGLSTPQYISNIERGLAPPSIEVLLICLDLYGLDPEELAFKLSKEYRIYILEELAGGPVAEFEEPIGR